MIPVRKGPNRAGAQVPVALDPTFMEGALHELTRRLGDLIQINGLQPGVARIGEGGEPIAMALRIGAKRFTPGGIERDRPEQFAFHAVTGEDRELPFDAYGTRPCDINGDGLDEFVRGRDILDRDGNVVTSLDGEIAAISDLLGTGRPQALTYRDDGTVRLNRLDP